jgi:hypothetical protein
MPGDGTIRLRGEERVFFGGDDKTRGDANGVRAPPFTGERCCYTMMPLRTA